VQLKRKRKFEMVRRIVTIDNDDGKSFALADNFLDNPLTDPARPGFKRQRIWMTRTTPCSIDLLSFIDLQKEILYPPKDGSVIHIYTFPPDDIWLNTIQSSDVKSYFESINTVEASLDLCVVLKGEVTLILDTTEVNLSAGDSIVQKASAHAWANRSSNDCIIAISSHHGKVN
jgi:mannose-6-phosphate isomerase-like protein (cupin superfamily)